MPKIAGELHDPYRGSFESLRFPKTGAQIAEKAAVIRERLMSEIENHATEVRGLAEEWLGLDGATEVLLQMESYTSGYPSDLPPAFVAQVRAHVRQRHQKRTEANRLRLIVEHLPKDEVFNLSFAELTFFEF